MEVVENPPEKVPEVEQLIENPIIVTKTESIVVEEEKK